MKYMILPLIPADPTGPLCVVVFARSSQLAAAGCDALDRLENLIRDKYDWPLSFNSLFVGDRGLEADWRLRYRVQEIVGNHQADILVVENVTRLGRDAHEVLDFVKWCVKRGVRVIAVDDAFDSADSFGG